MKFALSGKKELLEDYGVLVVDGRGDLIERQRKSKKILFKKEEKRDIYKIDDGREVDIVFERKKALFPKSCTLATGVCRNIYGDVKLLNGKTKKKQLNKEKRKENQSIAGQGVRFTQEISLLEMFWIEI